ncbi:HAD-IC family P-type ATPase [Rathayibacter sp. CAU 1779]
MQSQGLTSAEVAERHASGRANVTKQRTSRSVADILRENVFTLFNGILTACFVAIVLIGDLRDGFFFGVVVVNALIGIVQELRAKRVLDRLALLAASESLVIRDGEPRTVRIDEVVEDDVLVLRPGDQLPADARLTDSNGLAVDESLLTGESEPMLKGAGDELLSGSHVIAGTGTATVTAVGERSYSGRLTSEIRRHSLVSSELRNATNRILVYISWILGPLIVITLAGRIVAYGGFRAMAGAHFWPFAVRDAVASVVGMIPEGLVLLISLAFGVAAIQLATKKVLVQELAAVEVLARVDVLCLDKTGTLTTGEVAFDRLIALDRVSERDSSAAVAAFASDAAGNSTIGVLAHHFTASVADPTSRLPFNSTTKYSGVRFALDGRETTWLLGAPERLLAAHPADLAAAQTQARSGLRVLALVRSTTGFPDATAGPSLDVEVVPAALLTFRETLRSDAAETLEYFAGQSVRVVVMSGDNPITVAALARTLGMDSQAIDAATLTDAAAWREALAHHAVFGRVTPDQKREAIGILHELGHTVAMTGDGVNDAMAIKDADLGIAMGGATAATKAVSRIVLLDNRFGGLPDVLALGRRVIANVERVANLFLAKTTYGIVLALVTAFAALPFPFLPRQLTLVSTLAIGIPSFFLALASNRRIYTPGVLPRILKFSIPAGVIAAATCILAFLPLRQAVGLDEARSVATISLFVVSLWIVVVLARPFSVPRAILVASVTIAGALVCVVPFTRSFFMLEVHGDPALAYGIAVGVAGAIVIELFARFAKRRSFLFDRV